MKLKISKEISLPIDAITQTMAAIGRKGSGKTYLSQMIAEQMLDAEAQVVVIDPVGNWWGLRVNEDGKTKGKEIFVIGGDHGDVPLVPEAGKRIAQLLVEKGISAIIDVSGFGVGEHKRFCADFGEEFFQLKKKNRTPVHLFLEEAQLIVPQNIRPEEGRMYSSFERIVRLGRNYGIGCTIITQRPQSVNKEVLSQVECLCVLQITGPHERKALEYWVQEVGADRTLIGELPGLSQGEGYVWSPQWLGIFKRVHFSKKQTFDASATPVVGKKTQAASLSAVDVEALKIAMADVVEQAEKDDPTALRKKIRELQNHKCPVVNQNPVKIQKITVPVVGKKTLEGMKVSEAKMRKMLAVIRTYMQTIEESVESFSADIRKAHGVPAPEQKFIKVEPDTFKKMEYKVTVPTPVVEGDTKPLTGGALRMLQVLVSRYPMQMSKTQLATFSKLKPSSGTYGTYMSTLRSRGFLIENDGMLTASQIAIDELGASPTPPQTSEEVVRMWQEVLSGGARRMFDFLVSNHPQEFTKEELGQNTGLDHSSGTFGTYLSMLRSNGLIEVKSGNIKASENLFI